MIKLVEHTTTAAGAADFALAVGIAGALHAPTAPSRAPELAIAGPGTGGTGRRSKAAGGTGRRSKAARARRRTVQG